MEGLRFVPPRVPLVEPKTGIVTREWYLFLQGVFDRIGGAIGPSTPDIAGSLFEDAGSGETNAMLFTGLDSLAQIPPFPEFQPPGLDQNPVYAETQAILLSMQAEIDAQRDLIAELTKTIQGIQQGLSQ